MARVSRSEKQRVEEKKKVRYLIGMYHRLSSEDERADEDNSIGNQHKICLEYVKQIQDAELIETYVDNGATGTNFHRHSFERMMEDIRRGRINCIIVKDLSRFGRNYLESSEYIEKIFPAAGVRFIAVNNGYDSGKGADDKQGIVIPFSNMVNEMYARDTSKKIRSSIDTLMKKGEFLPAAGSIPYGYLRDEENNTYQVDLQTAEVVKLIFEKKLEGMSNCGIATFLNKEGIPSPGRIRCLRGVSRDRRHENALWTHKAVKEILKNKTYLGHRIHGKVKRDRVGEKKERREEATWQYIYHAHPPIVTEEDFLRVQEIIDENEKRREKYIKRKEADRSRQELLQGKVFCGDCGAPMSVMKRNQRSTSDREPALFYQCNAYQYSGRVVCSNHYISQDSLLKKVENAINLQISLAMDREKLLQGTSAVRMEACGTCDIVKCIRGLEAESKKVQAKIEKLLADYNEGLVDKQEYIYIKKRYDNIAKQLAGRMSLAETEERRMEERMQQADDWIKTLLEYGQSRKLDRQLAEKLIDRITVFVDRSVEIQFRFRNELKEGQV